MDAEISRFDRIDRSLGTRYPCRLPLSPCLGASSLGSTLGRAAASGFRGWVCSFKLLRAFADSTEYTVVHWMKQDRVCPDSGAKWVDSRRGLTLVPLGHMDRDLRHGEMNSELAWLRPS